MAIVSIAIVVSFHLKSQPTALELRMAKPLGIIFWLLSLSCLVLGFGNYIQTVQKYSRRMAIVQTGWKTQSVSSFLLSLVRVEWGFCRDRWVLWRNWKRFSRGLESGEGGVGQWLADTSRFAEYKLTPRGTGLDHGGFFHCGGMCSLPGDKFEESLIQLH